MKKLLSLLVFLGVIVGGVAFALTSTPERHVCVRMAELCSIEGNHDDLEQCVSDLEELEKITGEEPVMNAAKCLEEADSCPQAVGCVAGAGYKAVPDIMSEFMKGFANAQK